MPRPLIRDPEPDNEQEQQPTQQNPLEPLQPAIQKGSSFWDALKSAGGWLAKQRLPEPAKKGLKDFGHQVWYSREDYDRMKRAERRAQGMGREPTKRKWTATPFKSFTPKEKKKR